MSDQTEPVSSPTSVIAEGIQKCRAPFTTAAVKWKIQTNPKDQDSKKRAAVVAFIDARLAGERLNAAGLNWSSKYTPVPGGLLCTITVTDGRGFESLERSDVGWSRGTGDNMTLKTLYSDAFKRAAVHFGVGVSIYALPIKYLSGQDDEIVQRGKNWYISSKGQKALDAHYERWLEQVGIPQFGEPINHGDVDGAQGDVESEDRANDEAVANDTSASKAAPENAKATTQPAASADDKVVTEDQMTKILEAFAQSSKAGADVATYLASKGVEGFQPEQSLDQLLAMKLPYETGKGLYVWLKRNAAAKAAA